MDVSEAGERAQAVLGDIGEVVVVDRTVLWSILTGLTARGHVLLEDVPGTGKTLTARTFATTLGLSFSRIQMTADLLPTDITGTNVFNEKERVFEFREGPLFANLVLADEINRASPKTQAALLEAMEEKQVTVDGTTHQLPEPFFVIATQNPVEDGQGTFPLPAAQKDRFLVKNSLGYPDEAGEIELLDRRDARDVPTPSAEPLLSTADVRELQQVPERVEVHDDIKQYLVDIVRGTREDPRVEVGVSPRGSQRLFEVARASAALDGRDFVTPDDVKWIAEPVLAHRLVLTADASVNDVTRADVVQDVLGRVEVPRIRGDATPPQG